MAATSAQQVRKHAAGRCEYCRLPRTATSLPFEIDHIIARKHGGRTITANLALACWYCNSFKGPNISGLDPQAYPPVSPPPPQMGPPFPLRRARSDWPNRHRPDDHPRTPGQLRTRPHPPPIPHRRGNVLNARRSSFSGSITYVFSDCCRLRHSIRRRYERCSTVVIDSSQGGERGQGNRCEPPRRCGGVKPRTGSDPTQSDAGGRAGSGPLVLTCMPNPITTVEVIRRTVPLNHRCAARY